MISNYLLVCSCKCPHPPITIICICICFCKYLHANIVCDCKCASSDYNSVTSWLQYARQSIWWCWKTNGPKQCNHILSATCYCSSCETQVQPHNEEKSPRTSLVSSQSVDVKNSHTPHGNHHWVTLANITTLNGNFLQNEECKMQEHNDFPLCVMYVPYDTFWIVYYQNWLGLLYFTRRTSKPPLDPNFCLTSGLSFCQSVHVIL